MIKLLHQVAEYSRANLMSEIKLDEWDDGVDDPDPGISIEWKILTGQHK
jgi:hypothetical protein